MLDFDKVFKCCKTKQREEPKTKKIYITNRKDNNLETLFREVQGVQGPSFNTNERILVNIWLDEDLIETKIFDNEVNANIFINTIGDFYKNVEKNIYIEERKVIQIK